MVVGRYQSIHLVQWVNPGCANSPRPISSVDRALPITLNVQVRFFVVGFLEISSIGLCSLVHVCTYELVCTDLGVELVIGG